MQQYLPPFLAQTMHKAGHACIQSKWKVTETSLKRLSTLRSNFHGIHNQRWLVPNAKLTWPTPTWLVSGSTPNKCIEEIVMPSHWCHAFVWQCVEYNAILIHNNALDTGFRNAHAPNIPHPCHSSHISGSSAILAKTLDIMWFNWCRTFARKNLSTIHLSSWSVNPCRMVSTSVEAKIEDVFGNWD